MKPQNIGLVFGSIAILCISNTRAFGDCKVENITSSKYKNPVELIQDFTGVVAEFPVGEITGVSIKKGQYLQIDIVDDKIQIKPSAAFANFEEDNEPFVYGIIRFFTTILFECDNGVSTLEFEQRIKDINDNAPYFNKELYDFKFGMSLLAGFVLSSEIIASDDDMKKGFLKFGISGEWLKIERSGATVGTRSDYTKVTLLKDIELPFDEEFTLTVTDDGVEPFLSGTSKLRLTLQGGNQMIQSPLFSRPIFHWSYRISQNIMEYSEGVTLSRFGPGLTVKQLGYEDYFELNLQDPAKSLVQISWKKHLVASLFESGYLPLEIEAKIPGAKQTAKTVVLIKLV